LTEFTLTDQHGQPFESKSLQGKVWVASFFFANCPQICRMQNMQVAKLQNKYADRGVELVSITCDPQRDTPAALASYAEMFNAEAEHWHFLTGDLLYIRRIGAEIFQVAVEEETHSDRLLVIDRDGKIRGTYRATKPEQFAALESTLDELLEATEDVDAEGEAGGAVEGEADGAAVETGDEATGSKEHGESDETPEPA
jgi:protein SCO1/2